MHSIPYRYQIFLYFKESKGLANDLFFIVNDYEKEFLELIKVEHDPLGEWFKIRITKENIHLMTVNAERYKRFQQVLEESSNGSADVIFSAYQIFDLVEMKILSTKEINKEKVRNCFSISHLYST